MRNRLLVTMICLLLVVATVGFVPLPVAAQGDAAVVCDSTLITLLYVAEKNYGFKSMMDVATFEKGQFKPWFEAMMSMDDGMMDETMEPMMEGTMDAMMDETMEPMMEGTKDPMMGDGMMAELKPGVVQGENESCTKLRAEVEAYLVEKLSSDTMMK